MSRMRASSDIFHAIADPTRRAIIDLLQEDDRPVWDLARSFKMSQPSLSQHLRVLRDVGLVRQRKSGRERRYGLRPAGLRPVAEWVAQYERFWQHKLGSLGEHLRNRP